MTVWKKKTNNKIQHASQVLRSCVRSMDRRRSDRIPASNDLDDAFRSLLVDSKASVYPKPIRVRYPNVPNMVVREHDLGKGRSSPAMDLSETRCPVCGKKSNAWPIDIKARPTASKRNAITKVLSASV